MKRNIDFRILVVFLAAAGFASLRGAPARAWTEQDGAVNADLPEMVVEAENQVRQDIQKSTLEFDLSAAVIDTFFSREDEMILSISPVEGMRSLVNNPGTLDSDQVPHFWAPEMAGSPVATFYPEEPEGHESDSWILTVTDFRGSPFREYEGDGRPPETLGWDGRDDQGGILDVGYPYSYIFTITDKGTNTYNYAGVSFRIPALDSREGRDRHLDFAGDRIFAHKGRAELSDPGREWLTGALDIVRRDNPYSPLKVFVVAEEEQLAIKRAEVVKDFVTSEMILAPDKVEVATAVRPNLRAELDGSVGIEIGHAD